jgi:HEAT repeat protein
MARRDVEYKLNEPKPEIPGGGKRASVRVNREKLGAVAQRERIEKALAVHDHDGTPESVRLSEEDGPILRIMARETIASSLQPALRARAIAALAQYPGTENLNLLSELAAFGDDVYVRSHALLALGSTGLLLAATPLANALRSAEKMERTAAGKALLLLAFQAGHDAVEALLPTERDRKLWRTISASRVKPKVAKRTKGSKAKKMTSASRRRKDELK